MQPIAYTPEAARQYIGITRQAVYLMLRRHDPQTKSTVLVPYAGETGIIGDLHTTLIDVASVERAKLAEDAKRDGD